MSALCISGGGAMVKILATAFTLGFIHSIEKVPIEESWRVEGDHLRLVESRIKGSGAGIEPGTGARLENGWYVWSPPDPLRQSVTLRRSGFLGTGDWTLCWSDTCRLLGNLLPPQADPVTLRRC